MIDWMNVILPLTVFLNVLAAVLSWAAKLRFSREYAAAKDELIKSKEAHIKQLQEMNPTTMRRHIVSLNEELKDREARIKELEVQLGSSHTENANQKNQIEQEGTKDSANSQGKLKQSEANTLTQYEQLLTEATQRNDTLMQILIVARKVETLLNPAVLAELNTQIKKWIQREGKQ
ncbi:hypothetical protein HYR54_02755 [Candidatus Acetothermia bacterium]|nr:hypothetical protein [Candidatus Acetothermia bacterium]